MRVEQRTIYIANDGTEFISAKACTRHESLQRVLAALEEADVDWHDPDLDAIAAGVVSRFAVVPREDCPAFHTQLREIEHFLSGWDDCPDNGEAARKGIATLNAVIDAITPI